MNPKEILAALLLTVVLVPGTTHGQASFESLPDWSGVWRMVGNTVFDRATVNPDGDAGSPGVREHPPYTEEWEALYRQHIELVKQRKFPDPFTSCGYPAGYPRIMNLPDVYEFVVRPEQVWILAENGPNVVRIYTDGRNHPAPEDRWPTYSGDSVGHWEGDTLVFTTVSVKGWNTDRDSILDRTGLVISDQLRTTTRMRKIDENTIEAQMTLEDPKALTRPWLVTKRYVKQAKGTRMYDYGCAENNRNPVNENGRTLTLGPDGKPLDRDVD